VFDTLQGGVSEFNLQGDFRRCHEVVIGHSYTYVALGSNAAGAWGEPRATLNKALVELERSGISVIFRSSIYRTKAVGGGRQPPYLNAVIAARTSQTPSMLLRTLKQLERASGRRLGRHWGPRPLDLDIIDAHGVVLNWPPRLRVRGGLILPHPEMATRAFVLVPLKAIAPHWHHPALRRTIDQLLASQHQQRRNVRYMLDFHDAT
jgi:2-amino-4-hydroxy-6-hydroxymethyldihydropteridine diphosphokinase